MLAAVLSRPSCAASIWPRFAATTGMKALQLHQVSKATMVVSSALRVRGQSSGENNSLIRGGAELAAACCQRSGSLMKRRTKNAAAAGSRPKIST